MDLRIKKLVLITGNTKMINIENRLTKAIKAHRYWVK